MKKLLLGNEAVARGLYEAGCRVASSYPGTPSTEITEYAAKYEDIYCEWAPNEKVAMEVACGAAIAGARSFCAMKHVGLNVACDPLFTASYTGVNAGMVIAVADDPGMHSSQNEQDSRHYAVSAKLPMLEPADSEEARAFAKRAFQLSEEYDTPVFLKLCTRIAHSQSIVELGEREEVPAKPYEKNIAKYVMVPGNARPRHPIVEERTQRLTAYAETTDLNREELGTDRTLGIITSSTCYQYAREVFGPQASILKLGLVNPLPREKILAFAAKVDQVLVLEELDPVPGADAAGTGDSGCSGRPGFGLGPRRGPLRSCFFSVQQSGAGATGYLTDHSSRRKICLCWTIRRRENHPMSTDSPVLRCDRGRSPH